MKRRKSSAKTGVVFFWSKQEYRRFIDATERLVASVNDLTIQVASLKAKRPAKRPPVTDAQDESYPQREE